MEDWRLIYREGRQKANSMEEWICNVKDVNIIDTGSRRYCAEASTRIGRYLNFMDLAYQNQRRYVR